MVNVGNYAEVSYERGVHIDSNPIIRNFLSQCLGIDQRSKKLIVEVLESGADKY